MNVTFCKTDIVPFAIILFTSQPSIVVGSTGGLGRGWPKAIQNKNASDVRHPIIVPPSVAVSVPMPSVKTPNIGPPTIPKIVKLVYDKRNCTTNSDFNVRFILYLYTYRIIWKLVI